MLQGKRLVNLKMWQETLSKMRREENKGRKIVQRIGSRGTSSSSLFHVHQSPQRKPAERRGGRHEALNSEFSEKCKLAHPRSSVNPKLKKHEEQNQTTRHVFIEMPKTSGQDGILKVAKEQVIDQGTKIRMTAAVGSEARQAEARTASLKFGSGKPV